MFWKYIEPNMTPRLAAAVDASYAAFAGYRLWGNIVACHCNSCMTEETEKELVRTPLRQISTELLSEYTNSAHGYDTDVIEHEFKYFLPRYLDLIAHCKPPHYMDSNTCLHRLGDANFRAAWPRHEVEAVDECLDAFVDACLSQTGLAQWPVGWRLEFEINDVIVMIATARGDVERALATWELGADPAAALHLANFRISNLEFKDGAFRSASPFLTSDFPAAAQRLGQWGMQESWTKRIEDAYLTVDVPRQREILEAALGGA